MKNIKTKIIIASILLFPSVIFAQTKDLKYLAGEVTNYIQIAIALILSLAVLMFVYNVYKYFISGSDDVSSKKDAGLYVMWSVIGFFVILSFWGLVNILLKSFQLDNQLPTNSIFGTFKSSNNNNSNSIFNQKPDLKVNPPSDSGSLKVNPPNL